MKRDHGNPECALMLGRHKVPDLGGPQRRAVLQNHVHMRWHIDLIVLKAPILPLNGRPKHSVDLACAAGGALPWGGVKSVYSRSRSFNCHERAVRVNH